MDKTIFEFLVEGLEREKIDYFSSVFQAGIALNRAFSPLNAQKPDSSWIIACKKAKEELKEKLLKEKSAISSKREEILKKPKRTVKEAFFLLSAEESSANEILRLL